MIRIKIKENNMKIEFSMFSSFRSLIGFEIERNGAVRKDENDSPVFQRTVEVTIGFLFGYVSLNFDLGNAVSIEKLITEHKDLL
jgi:hypothetical protein